MTDDTALNALLVLSLVLAVALVLASSATLGRKLAELEYQQAAGLNGVRRIQAIINVRTHGNRVVLGLTFLVTGVMTMAEVPLLWRTWVGRVLFIGVLVAYAASSVLDWIDEARQVKILLKEDEDRLRKESDERGGRGESPA